MMSEKIRPHHLERKAILYVRQSSAHQVLQPRQRVLHVDDLVEPRPEKVVLAAIERFPRKHRESPVLCLPGQGSARRAR
jgi:hypothetical protein